MLFIPPLSPGWLAASEGKVTDAHVEREAEQVSRMAGQRLKEEG